MDLVDQNATLFLDNRYVQDILAVDGTLYFTSRTTSGGGKREIAIFDSNGNQISATTAVGFLAKMNSNSIGIWARTYGPL